jgi:hypothetical protein
VTVFWKFTCNVKVDYGFPDLPTSITLFGSTGSEQEYHLHSGWLFWHSDSQREQDYYTGARPNLVIDLLDQIPTRR